jgi:beta-barrel assembly-enhancing protease
MEEKMYLKVNSRKSRLAISLTLAMAAAGCSGSTGLKSLSSSILGSTGLVSSSQVESVFSAVEKGSKAFSKISPQDEYHLGRAVAANIFDRYPPSKDTALINYVNKVGATLVAFSDRPEIYNGYHFMVLESPELNAVSAPGGFVFVTSGLIKRLPDEDSLAAVLAHEIGHEVLEHGMKAIADANAKAAALILGKEAVSTFGGSEAAQISGIFGDSISGAVETLLVKGYSRGQEYDADEYAAKLLARAGYNQKSIVAVLDAVESAQSGGASGGWLSTHPSAEDRKDELEGELAEPSPALAQGQTLRANRFRQFVKKVS